MNGGKVCRLKTSGFKSFISKSVGDPRSCILPKNRLNVDDRTAGNLQLGVAIN